MPGQEGQWSRRNAEVKHITQASLSAQGWSLMGCPKVGMSIECLSRDKGEAEGK